MSYDDAHIVCADLHFGWPDGQTVFDGLNLAIGPGRTGLVAPNGVGKSTLLRLLVGELRPSQGSVRVKGQLGYLPQDLTLDPARGVDDVLGLAPIRLALRAIEAGEARDEHWAAVGDDWSAEERARASLDRLGLGHVELDRRLGSLSGGEAMLVALSSLLLAKPDVLLLDEPTNNLDIDARQRLYRAVEEWPGVMVLVSHDRALLERVDQIVDIGDGGAVTHGGDFTAYLEALAQQQEAAQRAVRTAEADVRRQQRELIEARIKLDRRVRKGRKQEAEARFPKVLAKERKRQAQVSAGKLRDLHQERLDGARQKLSDAEQLVRDDDEIRVDLPDTEVPAGRSVLTCEGVGVDWLPARVDLLVRGPERVALLGPNGIGKTTFLRVVAGELSPQRGDVRAHVPVRRLPQRLDLLDDSLSVFDNVRRHAPSGDVNVLRARLARLLFRGASADQMAGTLSGGERFRASLATLLSAQPPPQLLLLDEPTNSLDLASVRQVEQALGCYRGALIVASHDLTFLSEVGITRWLRLDATGLHEVDPPASVSPVRGW